MTAVCLQFGLDMGHVPYSRCWHLDHCAASSVRSSSFEASDRKIEARYIINSQYYLTYSLNRPSVLKFANWESIQAIGQLILSAHLTWLHSRCTRDIPSEGIRHSTRGGNPTHQQGDQKTLEHSHLGLDGCKPGWRSRRWTILRNHHRMLWSANGSNFQGKAEKVAWDDIQMFRLV